MPWGRAAQLSKWFISPSVPYHPQTCWGHTVPSSRWSVLNTAHLSTDQRGAQWAFSWALWCCWVPEISIHPTIPFLSPYNMGHMRTTWETVTKALLNSKHTRLTRPPHPPNQPSHHRRLSVEEIWFPLYNSMQIFHLHVSRPLEIVSIQQQILQHMSQRRGPWYRDYHHATWESFNPYRVASLHLRRLQTSALLVL